MTTREEIFQSRFFSSPMSHLIVQQQSQLNFAEMRKMCVRKVYDVTYGKIAEVLMGQYRGTMPFIKKH